MLLYLAQMRSPIVFARHSSGLRILLVEAYECADIRQTGPCCREADHPRPVESPCQRCRRKLRTNDIASCPAQLLGGSAPGVQKHTSIVDGLVPLRLVHARWPGDLQGCKNLGEGGG